VQLRDYDLNEWNIARLERFTLRALATPQITGFSNYVPFGIISQPESKLQVMKTEERRGLLRQDRGQVVATEGKSSRDGTGETAAKPSSAISMVSF
jgi:hypothetical protein